MEKYKTIQKREEYFIDFTDQEKKELGWKDNQKFDWVLLDDGSVQLKPWVSMDLGEISEFPREVLEILVLESIEKDITINQVVNDILKEIIKSTSLQEA